MDSIKDILKDALAKKASDIIIVAGSKLSYRINGQIIKIAQEKFSADFTEKLIHEIYTLGCKPRNTRILTETCDDDFSFTEPEIGRFRCNVYRQRDSLSAILRVVTTELPNYNDLNIPENIINLSRLTSGLVLVTGCAGSGKSTTLACVIDQINKTRSCHIITLEDPIEFLHKHLNSIVSQREINHDTLGYEEALRAVLRQTPDVILMGEMRDFETIRTVITAAETGHLVLSTLHTISASSTINRVIDVFPPNQQQQIRIQLAMVLEAIISQKLVPTIDGNLTPVFEILVATPAIRNMIRESKVHQIDNVLYTGTALGMRALDTDLLRLFHANIITKDTALFYCNNPDTMIKKLCASAILR